LVQELGYDYLFSAIEALDEDEWSLENASWPEFIGEHPEILDIIEEESNRVVQRKPELLPFPHRLRFPDMTDEEIHSLSCVPLDLC
jgi:hypothetical protein